MSNRFTITSQCGIDLLCREWRPDAPPKAVVQLVHGITEHSGRYTELAEFLCQKGFAVVAHDHMGHGGSVCGAVPRGCVEGGWRALEEDVLRLRQYARAQWPGVPFVYVGHSMGSFLVRTLLIDCPEDPPAAAVLTGTAWKSPAALRSGIALCASEARLRGERAVSPGLYGAIFGSYNRPFAPVRTRCDWVSRDEDFVDSGLRDPLGFVPSVGMLLAMLRGMLYNQNIENLANMDPDVPSLLLSGAADPVGDFGKGVQKTAEAFRGAGVKDVTVRLWPGARHAILQEINRVQVRETLYAWLTTHLPE